MSQRRGNINRVLNNLDSHVTEDKQRQIKLFLRCIDIKETDLEKPDSDGLIYLYNLLLPRYKEDSSAYMQYILQSVHVQGADSIQAPKDLLQKAEKHLAYPSLLVYVCQQLSNSSYLSLKACLCSGTVLQSCDPDTISSREDLMTRLHHERKISPTKSPGVFVLSFWLKAIHQNLLASRVDEYQESVQDEVFGAPHLDLHNNSSGAGVRATSQTTGGIPAPSKIPASVIEAAQPKDSHSDLSGSQVLNIESLQMKTGVTDKQIDLEVTDTDLHHLAKCFNTADDKFLVELRLTSSEIADVKSIVFRRGVQAAMTKALTTWKRRYTLNATYEVLIMTSLAVDSGEVAHDICKYLKQRYPDPVQD